MTDENKNKKRSILEFIGGEQLSKVQAKKLKHPNDPEVLELERKHPTVNLSGDVCKDRPLYLYEPHVRYERSENPDYKRYKNYSLAGTITGLGMLATGFASLNYALAYAGAALAIASLGYQSGHWYSKYKTDRRFEKVSGLEKKVEEPVQELVKEPKDEGLYQSLKHWITNYMFKKSPGLEEKVQESKDERLYVRRTHKSYETGHCGGGPMYYGSLTEPQPRDFHRYSVAGTTGIILTSVLASIGLTFYSQGSGVEPILYATGASALATLGHYLGYIFGKDKAKPEYQKVSGLEEKD